jgi:hypothetical protein
MLLYIDMNSTIEMSSTLAWTAQLHEQYNNMDSTIDMNSTIAW